VWVRPFLLPEYARRRSRFEHFEIDYSRRTSMLYVYNGNMYGKPNRYPTAAVRVVPQAVPAAGPGSTLLPPLVSARGEGRRRQGREASVVAGGATDGNRRTRRAGA
jgi:hypothetical protein